MTGIVIRNCKFGYKWSSNWSEAEEAEDTSIWRCDFCKKDVPVISTKSELDEAIQNNRCVVFRKNLRGDIELASKASTIIGTGLSILSKLFAILLRRKPKGYRYIANNLTASESGSSSIRETPFSIIIISTILACAFFIFDLSLPLGVAGGVLYVALVLMGMWFSKTSHIYLLATLGSVLTVIGYFASPDGGIFWVVLVNRGLALFVIWITAFLVIASIKQSKSTLASSEKRFLDVAERASDWFWEMGPDLRFTYLSDRFFEVSGVQPETMIGSRRTRHPNTIGNNTEDMKWNRHVADLEAHRPFREFEYSLKTSDNRILHVSVSGVPLFGTDGTFQGYRGTGTNISERKKAYENLKYQASHDSLTGLINRGEFEQRAKRLLLTVQQDNNSHALCLMDIDQFKVINDTCGHTAGDELLRQLSQVLQGTVRHRDTLARLGGDEFGVLVEHCTLEQAERVANALRQDIENFQFSWQGQPFRVGVSIGLVAVNKTTPDLTELLKQADTACYMAKDLGRNRIHVYRPEDVEMARHLGQMAWVAGINQALEEDRFCLYAQPIVPLDNSAQRHYEMLLRMIDKEGNVIGPGTFMSAAERYGLMGKLDRWVIENALTLLAENPTFLEEIEFVSINLSGESLSSSDFLDFIMVQLKKSGIDASKICFEVTETLAISNLSAATTFISTLKKTGCYFALDDFGSGLSSFAYLKNLKVDYLKIDGMFVTGIVEDEIDRAMVRSINDIGQVMGMKTIAEYVENDKIKSILREIGVNYAQGNGVGEPQPFEELVDLSVFRVMTME